jgi:hypothetical protein
VRGRGGSEKVDVGVRDDDLKTRKVGGEVGGNEKSEKSSGELDA